jgi:hypothetical protein
MDFANGDWYEKYPAKKPLPFDLSGYNPMSVMLRSFVSFN